MLIVALSSWTVPPPGFSAGAAGKLPDGLKLMVPFRSRHAAAAGYPSQRSRL